MLNMILEIAHQKHSLVLSHLDISRTFSQVTVTNKIGLYMCNTVSNIKISASFPRIVFANLFILYNKSDPSSKCINYSVFVKEEHEVFFMWEIYEYY
jgi:hypothetical protein